MSDGSRSSFPLEGHIRALFGHATLVVDEADEARCVVGDRVQEHALALLLRLEPVPFGDVEAGGDVATTLPCSSTTGLLRQ